jgi:hypothetical protein
VAIAFIARYGSRARREYGVIEANIPGTQDRDVDRTRRRRELDAAADIIILDYVILDFVDDTLDTRRDPQRKIMEGPGLLY